MAEEEKDSYKKLEELAANTPDLFTEDQANQYSALINDIVASVLSGADITSEQYHTIMKAGTNKFQAIFTQSLAKLPRDDANRFVSYLIEKDKELNANQAQLNKQTRKQKGDHKDIYLQNIKNAVKEKDKEKIAKNIASLGNEFSRYQIVLTGSNFRTLKDAFKAFPDAVDDGFKRVRVPHPNFEEAYKNITQKDDTQVTSLHSEAKDLADSFTSLLRAVPAKLATENTAEISPEITPLASETPTIETPDPEIPVPETPTIKTPDPEIPVPETPTTETPIPEAPTDEITFSSAEEVLHYYIDRSTKLSEENTLSEDLKATFETIVNDEILMENLSIKQAGALIVMAMGIEKDDSIDNKKDRFIAEIEKNSFFDETTVVLLKNVLIPQTDEPEVSENSNKEYTAPIIEPEASENSAEERVAALATIKINPQSVWDNIEKPNTEAIRKQLDNASDEDLSPLPVIDDLVAANELFKDSTRYSGQLYDITIARLSSLKPEDITPNNAASYRLLCSQCIDDSIRKTAESIIADALIQYDRDNFGDKSAEQLEKDYKDLSVAAKKTDPFADKKVVSLNVDGKEVTIDLDQVVFSPKEKNAKEQQEQKNTIMTLAREMAVERLLKNTSWGPDDLEKEIAKATAEIILSSGPTERKDGKIEVKKDNLASSVANQYLDIDNFKNRALQKFKKTAFGKEVTTRVDNIDKKLTAKYGKKYTYAKNALNVVGKVAVSAGKTAALYGIASAIPGGMPILLGYNIYKTVKTSVKQLKDENLTTSQKVGVGINAVVSAGLQTVGLGSSVSTFLSPEVFSTIAPHLSCVGPWARRGIGAAAALVPNAVEGANIGIQQCILKIKRAFAKDYDSVKDIDNRLERLKKRAKDNGKDALVKGVSTAIGTLISAPLTSFVMEKDEAVSSELTAEFKEVTDETPTLTNSEATQDHIPDQTQSLMAENTNEQTSSPDAPQPGATTENTQSTAATENTATDVNTVHQENLAAATAENSGIHEGKSIYGDAEMRTMNAFNNGSLHLEDPTATLNGLAENFGKNMDAVTYLSLQEPHTLQAALQLEGLGDHPTSAQLMQALATTALTPEQTETLNNYISNHDVASHYAHADNTSTATTPEATAEKSPEPATQTKQTEQTISSDTIVVAHTSQPSVPNDSITAQAQNVRSLQGTGVTTHNNQLYAKAMNLQLSNQHISFQIHNQRA